MDTQIFVLICLVVGFIYRFVLDDLEYKEIVSNTNTQIELDRME